MKKRFIFAALFFWVACNASAETRNTLIVRVSDIPPQYFQVQGGWTGLAVETMEALLKEAGFQPEYRKIPWKRALVELKEGRIDAMMNVTYTAERAQDYHYLWAKKTDVEVLVVKSDTDFNINSLDDLKRLPHKVAFETGNVLGETFDAKYKNDEDFRNVFFPMTNLNQVDMLLRERVSGLLDMLANAKYNIKNDPKWKDLKIHPFVISEMPSFFAFSKKSISEKTLIKLHAANIRNINNETYDKIFRKWKY